MSVAAGDVEAVIPHMAFSDEGGVESGAKGEGDVSSGEVVEVDVGGGGVEEWRSFNESYLGGREVVGE